MEVFHRLGYPDYFAAMLGTAQLLGVLAILAPVSSHPARMGLCRTHLRCLRCHHFSIGRWLSGGPMHFRQLFAFAPGTRQLSRMACPPKTSRKS